MHYTQMNGYQATNILKGIRNAIFSEYVVGQITQYKLNYIREGDLTYYQLREAATTTIKKITDVICFAEEPLTQEKQAEWSGIILSHLVPAQSFLLDRFSYAIQYFEQRGREFVAGVHTEIQLLYYSLIHLWDVRIREQQWR